MSRKDFPFVASEGAPTRSILKWLGRLTVAIVAVVALAAVTVFLVRFGEVRRLARVKQFAASSAVLTTSSQIVLDQVSVIDGTGAPIRTDQSIVIDSGRITFTGPASERPNTPGAQVLDLRGRTVFPGIVGMHEHLFTTAASLPGSKTMLVQQSTAFPLMYLAAGVTSIRTAGSIAPEEDLATKQRIDRQEAIGPEMFLTSPYLEGAPPTFPEMHALTGADHARRIVDEWAARGMTSFKVYMEITPDELHAAIEEAHAHKLTVTGHLCAIGMKQAADLGIDNMEHGLLSDTELYSGKKPNECPKHMGGYLRELNTTDIQSPKVQDIIRDLVDHRVAITSTLAVFESELGHPPERFDERARQALTWNAWRSARLRRKQLAGYVAQFHVDGLMRKEMEFERAFARAGGTLLAGCDPTGDGGVLAGLGDQREIELLVDAGFSPSEAIQIATQHGANFLGIGDRTGTIAEGKQADVSPGSRIPPPLPQNRSIASPAISQNISPSATKSSTPISCSMVIPTRR